MDRKTIGAHLGRVASHLDLLCAPVVAVLAQAGEWAGEEGLGPELLRLADVVADGGGYNPAPNLTPLAQGLLPELAFPRLRPGRGLVELAILGSFRTATV